MLNENGNTRREALWAQLRFSIVGPLLAAAWDLSLVFLIDETSGKPLCRLYPLDKARNADKARRVFEPPDTAPDLGPPQRQMAPLLEKLMQDYAENGLPPAYLPFPETKSKEES